MLVVLVLALSLALPLVQVLLGLVGARYVEASHLESCMSTGRPVCMGLMSDGMYSMHLLHGRPMLLAASKNTYVFQWHWSLNLLHSTQRQVKLFARRWQPGLKA